MCGLNFIVGGTEAQVQDMNRATKHRGMTSMSEQTFQFSLGHVRLPILGGPEFDQPYHAYGWTFLFVGEIVNFRDLDPHAKSDVEVLADMWVLHGPSCVKLFDGFWSFIAIPDRTPWIAHVVVDFLSKKPLYVTRQANRIVISSEIRGIAAVVEDLTPDAAYFSSVRKWGYSMGPRTWASEVKKVPAGCHMMIDARDLSAKIEIRDIVLPDPGVDLRAAIVRSVKRRITASDVPVAMLLSGGLDSSIIYKIARTEGLVPRAYHVRNQGDYLVGLGAEVAKSTAVVDLQPEDLDEVLKWNEGPVDLGSMTQQYALGRAIPESVCLSGDGADELFGGYKRSMEYDSQGSDIYDELVHYHLPRLDKMMMAGTVELRSPFLAREVLAGALALPWHMRQNKCWLRGAFADILPESVTYGPKVPLKSPRVILDGLAYRHELCDRFLKMIEEGRT